MKAKLLFVAIGAVVLGAILEMPAMADQDEAISMWVSRVRLAYNGRSSSSPDRVVAMIHVRDANNSAVGDALVVGTWTLPDGTVQEEAALTDFQGIATFQVWAGRGTYEFCVEDVTREGWEYDPAASLEICDELEITRPFSPGR